jgi:four helix bundle suffix protein
MDRPKRLRKTGGYRHLRSFQTSTLIYDGTVSFCNRFIDLKSRTHDQMVQAARSGRQNIGEGNRAAAASSKSELELTNWARASLEELLLDFQDYLRQRRLPLWKKDSPQVAEVRAVGQRLSKIDPSHPTDPSDLIFLDPEDDGDRARYDLYAPWLEHKDPTVCANTLISLIHQANYLLDQQLAVLEQEFIEGGGFSEQLAAARIEHRQQQKNDSAPKCPQCGKIMTLRTAKGGKNPGSQFWGCTGYPECKGTAQV